MGYRGIFDKTLLEIGRTDIITKLLEENEDCISFLPCFATDERVQSGSLVYLDVVDFETDIWKQLIYHKNKWISDCLNAFLEYVKNMNSTNKNLAKESL